MVCVMVCVRSDCVCDGVCDGVCVCVCACVCYLLILHFGAGCVTGFETGNFMTMPCQPCQMGYYKDDAGIDSCIPCPGSSWTESVGATSASMCSICREDTCHSNGGCEIIAGSAGVPQCSCNPFYLAVDNCHFPWIGIGLSVVIAIIIVTVSFVVLYKRTRRAQRKASSYERLANEREEEVQKLERVWRIDPADVTFDHIVDSGSFGDVWLGEWAGRQVAIKQLRLAVFDMDNTAEAQFEQEAKLLRMCRHPNILIFWGWGTKDSLPFLVTEYMSRGSLRNILKDAAQPLDWDLRLRFALDCARGMRYLHSRDPPMLHRDLKSMNLLVGDTWTVKVADLGTVRLLSAANNCDRKAAKDLYKPGGGRRRRYMDKFVNGQLVQALLSGGSGADDAADGHTAADNSSGRGSGASRVYASGGGVSAAAASGGGSAHAAGNGGVAGGAEAAAINSGHSAGAGAHVAAAGSNQSGVSAGGSDGHRSGGSAAGSAESDRRAREASLHVAHSKDETNLLLTQGVGTLLWQAPEVRVGGAYERPADVYSFAIVLWEILTRRLPFDDLDDFWQIEAAVRRGDRPFVPLELQKLLPDFTMLMYECWLEEPQERPRFSEIVDRLETMQVDLHERMCSSPAHQKGSRGYCA
jgi:serine/threonine protein kinase